MRKKIKLLILLIVLTLTLGSMSVTYSRYVASVDGDVEVALARWQILVNNNDITSRETSTIEITPNIVENEYIRSNMLAPSSKGFFDIDIDPTNVDVSFNYEVTLDNNLEFEDIVINKYTIIDFDHNEDDELELFDIEENIIANTVMLEENLKPFTLRVYFEWYEDDNKVLTDEDDTDFINDVILNDLKLSIEASIKFEQHIP